MTIAEAREKCKSFARKAPRDVRVVAILVLASSLSFGLGYRAGLERQEGQGSALIIDTKAGATSTAGYVVAARGGTKYYSPDCASANRISDTNKIWFVSASAATEAGYTPSGKCPSR